ncbi:MAG: hypothetical protein M5U14_02215 [Acidimicrobiia bacterium]|nr:hypothetical protein [Acidimicrobiia bacterium]
MPSISSTNGSGKSDSQTGPMLGSGGAGALVGVVVGAVELGAVLAAGGRSVVAGEEAEVVVGDEGSADVPLSSPGLQAATTAAATTTAASADGRRITLSRTAAQGSRHSGIESPGASGSSVVPAGS